MFGKGRKVIGNNQPLASPSQKAYDPIRDYVTYLRQFLPKAYPRRRNALSVRVTDVSGSTATSHQEMHQLDQLGATVVKQLAPPDALSAVHEVRVFVSGAPVFSPQRTLDQDVPPCEYPSGTTALFETGEYLECYLGLLVEDAATHQASFGQFELFVQTDGHSTMETPELVERGFSRLIAALKKYRVERVTVVAPTRETANMPVLNSLAEPFGGQVHFLPEIDKEAMVAWRVADLMTLVTGRQHAKEDESIRAALLKARGAIGQ